MDQLLINRIVEAALLAASQPLTLVQLNGLFPLDEPAPDGSIAAALTELQAQCEDRGVELVEVASGWRYQVRADVHPWVTRLWSERVGVFGEYRDSFRRIDGRWYFSQRIFTIFRGPES